MLHSKTTAAKLCFNFPRKRIKRATGHNIVREEASVGGSVSGLSESGKAGAFRDARRRFTGLWRVSIRAMPFWLSLPPAQTINTHIWAASPQRKRLIGYTPWRSSFFIQPPIDSGAEYCEERVYLSVCMCVRACVRVCLSAIISLELGLHVQFSWFFCVWYYGGAGLVLLWRRGDMLCISSFMDDVMSAHKRRLLDVATQLRRSSRAALGL